MANMLPFNVRIPKITKSTISTLPRIQSANIFVGATKVFDPEGLFSAEFFGKVGDDKRFNQHGTIKLNIEIFHPQVYAILCRLKELYKAIMVGKAYAIWDDTQKDFIASNEIEGETGVRFFLKHWKDIEFDPRKSLKRRTAINVINKYKDAGALSEYVIVLPAGMRDVQINEDGRVEEDEINSLYRRLLMVAGTIPDVGSANNMVLDSTRTSLQRTFNEIYDLLFSMLKGKRGAWLSKFLSRRIANGTRNVLTAMNIAPTSFGSVQTPSVTDTQFGLYQAARGCLPVVINKLLEHVGSKFNRATNTAMLIDPKTLKSVSVELPSQTMDKFSTTDGLDKFINRYKEVASRHLPVKIKNYYLGLIYVDDQSNFLRLNSIDDLPKGLDRKFVRPITLAEIMYLCNYQHWSDPMVFVTRYPVTGEGSIYPSSPYVKCTVHGEVRWELDPVSGERIGEGYKAVEFPKYMDNNFLDSMIPHTSRLAGLGADFDGDAGCGDFTYSLEAMQEKKMIMGKRRFYVSTDNTLRTNLNIQILSLVLKNFTGDYV